MERGIRLAVLLALLPILPPMAAAEVSVLGVCVYPEEPNVSTGDCGPRPEKIGVAITIGTPAGNVAIRVGCQEDCDRTYELTLCEGVEWDGFPSPGGNGVAEGVLDRLGSDAERMVDVHLPGGHGDLDVRMKWDPRSCGSSLA